MNTLGDPAEFAVANEAEEEALDGDWAAGKLARLRDPLLAFVDRHRGEILGRARDNDLAALLQVTMELIRELRTIDLRSENRDQLQEIEKEVWYRGEEGNHDVQAIQADWAQRYGPGWRRWRMLQYLYAADRIAPDLIRRLQGRPIAGSEG